MNKTRYTLTEADMHLLADFQKADAAFFAAQKALNDVRLGDENSNGVVARYRDAYQDKQNKATVFAACVAHEVTGSAYAPVKPDMTADERLKLETAEGAL